MPRATRAGSHTPFIDFLRSCGLSENEALVYVSAVQIGNALVKDIAKQARLNRTTTYNLLLGLRKTGLVSSYQKRGLTHFSAAAPDMIRDMLTKRIEQQERLKQQLNTLLPEFKALFHSHAQGSKIQLYEGLESLPDIYHALYHDVRRGEEGLEFTNWGGRFHLFPKQLRQDIFDEFVEKGIWTRSLLIEDALTRSWVEKGLDAAQRKKIQLLPNPGWDFFCNLELCQDKVAIVTYRSDVEFQGVLIESRELATMFRFMFHALWKQSQ